MKRKLIALLLVTSLSATMILTNGTTVKASEQTPNKFATMQRASSNGKIELKNNILQLLVSETGGDFAAYTTGGDLTNPNDDNTKMLFGNTNSEGIKVGNKITYISDGKTGTNDSKWTTTAKTGNSVVSTYTVDNVTITRTLTLVKSPNSSLEDSIKFDYKLTNNAQTEQNVSLKLMLDTYVGASDAAPFSIPGLGQFNKGKTLTGDAVPNYWFAYDKLDGPTATTKATYPANSKPSELSFSGWTSSPSGTWVEPVYEDDYNGDSAVYAYWNDNKLAPGASKTITSYYAASSLNTSINSDISLSILNGASAIIEPNAQGVYLPYETTATLQNSGDIDLKNVEVKVVIPDQFKNIIAFDGEATNTIDLLKVNATSQKALKFNVLGDLYDDKDVSFDVTVKSPTTETRTQTQKLTIKANKQRALDASIEGGAAVAITPTPDNEYGTYYSKLKIKNISDAEIKNAKVKIVLPEGLSLEPTTTEGGSSLDTNDNDATVATPDSFVIESLAANAETSNIWRLKIAPGYEDRALTYKIIVDSGIEGEPAKELTQTLNVKGLTAPVVPEKPTTPPVQPEKPATKPAAESPKTGDAGSFGSLALAMISGLGFAVTKKKKYNSKH